MLWDVCHHMNRIAWYEFSWKEQKLQADESKDPLTVFWAVASPSAYASDIKIFLLFHFLRAFFKHALVLSIYKVQWKQRNLLKIRIIYLIICLVNTFTERRNKMLSLLQNEKHEHLRNLFFLVKGYQCTKVSVIICIYVSFVKRCWREDIYVWKGRGLTHGVRIIFVFCCFA
jgi:hypothetical protein